MSGPKRTRPAAAAPLDFLDPADNRTLLGYFRDLGQWHGYIKFLEPGRLQDNPDMPIHKLYVEPFVTPGHVHTDTPPEDWLPQAQPVLHAVAENRRLVLLGDPGSGKSTLVSWITWQLSLPGTTPWKQVLGPLVPFPMVLRELKLDANVTWASLLKGFLEHPVAEKLRTEPMLVQFLLERGQTFLLLDGLDEIGDATTRSAVQKAAEEGAFLYPHCHVLSTSRVVGYQNGQKLWPLERTTAFGIEQGVLFPTILDAQQQSLFLIPPEETLLYLAPFQDEQIEHFSRLWYTNREAANTIAEDGAANLVRAIHGSQSTLRLARNPNLLTLMALIHRVRRRLPHGRILLFEQIAEAYLEAIDAYRKIPSEFSLKEKKRWLAYIGYRMQARRREQEKERPHERVREILVEREEVRAWLQEAMKVSAGKPNPEVADRFLEHIGQRSGLLLPRGEGLFAFTHLSFQEYFAACHLEEQITSRRWAKGQIGPDDHPNPGDLALYANQSTWRESLILLFELLAEKRPDWIPELLELLFGAQFELASISGENRNRALLLTEVVLDDYSGLNEEDRRRAGEVCWIATGAQIGDLEALLRLPNLRELYLGGFQVSDLTPLQNLKQLQNLYLSSTQVSDLTPLQNLKQLQRLDLSWTQISDLTPLQNLKQLLTLDLESTQVSNLTPLQNLKQLRYLYLSSTQVSDLTSLQNLKQLLTLGLHSTQVSDLTPLQNLKQLQRLDLSWTQVSDLTPLQNLKQLQTLLLSSTQVSDLRPLQNLKQLQHLYLSSTQVSDLTPLQNLEQLQYLYLNSTQVSDLTPLEGLQDLIISR